MLYKKMKNTRSVINQIKPLLYNAVKQSDRHGLEEIRISKARAREILNLATAADKELEDDPLPRHFAHLDNKLGNSTWEEFFGFKAHSHKVAAK